MGAMSLWHWIILIGVVLLLFGRGKISELMGDVAQGIKAFKKGMSDDDTVKAEPGKLEPGRNEAAKPADHPMDQQGAKSQAS
ncbi:MAG: twin-arginine translocase TatA/TatE family subunit [Bradyrhizobiaceae bacterium]|nr:twin-arginine translocase TatA/TatE family subunit [Bradyrhizobiaceae bacterium]